MKTKILSCLVLILFVVQACGQNSPKTHISPQTTKTTADDKTSILEMLREFYTSYITECDKMPINEQNITDLKNRYFTKEFLKKLEEAEIDYDPVLNAQDCDKDWIKTLEINPVVEKENTYQVCYHYDTSEGKRTICVTLFLVKVNEKYLINGIDNL